jgi:hypothetical protein
MQILRQGQAISGPDGVYEVIVPPANNTVNNIPTNALGIIGTAPYGPKNTPVQFGDSSGLKFNFGGIGLGAFDLPTEAAMATKQGCSNVFGIRVTDGTDTFAAANLVDGTSVLLSLDSALYTGSLRNGDTRVVGVGTNSTSQTAPTSYKITLTRLGYQSEVFDNVPATGFQAAYITAVNQGQGNLRGPSQHFKAAYPALTPPAITAGMFTPAATGGTLATGVFKAVLTLVNAQGETTVSNEVSFTTTASTSSCAFANGAAFATGVTGKLYLTAVGGAVGTETFDIAVPNAGTVTVTAPPLAGSSAPPAANTANILNTSAPAQGTSTLAGGTDGATGVTSNTLLGVDGTGASRTGMYALRGAGADGGIFILAGCTDSTTWSTMLSFGQSANLIPGACFPLGMTTAAAVALKSTAGASDWQILYAKDWFYIKDTDNGINRYVSPMGVIYGFIANLSAEQSPGNKQMSGFIGTERTMSGIAYDANELLQLESAGILVVTNPIPYGKVFGLAHGRNGSPNPDQNQICYSRLTLMISLSQAAALGKFIDRLQSTRADDPSRMAAKAMMDEYMDNMKRPLIPGGYGMIEDFKNVADTTLNTAGTIRQGLAIGYSNVSYLGVIEKFIWSLQGGIAQSVKQ